jgi:hypothetical protein
MERTDMEKIFISRSHNSDLPLELENSGNYKIVDVYKDAIVGERIYHHILKMISECSIFIGINSSEETSNWLMFEMGIAYSLKKPIIMIHKQNVYSAVFDLEGILNISEEETQNLEFFVGKLLGRTPYLTIKADSETDKNASDISVTGSSLINEIRNMIVHSGGVSEISQSSVNYQKYGWQPDLSIWIDSIDSAIGNPLLVAVRNKMSLTSALNINKQVARSVKKFSSGSCVLIIYKDGIDDKLIREEIKSPTIRYIQKDNLEEMISKDGVGRAILNIFVGRLY